VEDLVMTAIKMKTVHMHLTFLPEWDIVSISSWGDTHDVTLRFRREQAQELVELLKKFLEKENG
jgi:hypothetical protein